jgi:hypothetical protein
VYHTHGNKVGFGEIFSPQDRGFHNLRHWIGYLGPPAAPAGTLATVPLNKVKMTVFSMGESEHENLPTRVVDRLSGVGVFVG